MSFKILTSFLHIESENLNGRVKHFDHLGPLNDIIQSAWLHSS